MENEVKPDATQAGPGLPPPGPLESPPTPAAARTSARGRSAAGTQGRKKGKGAGKEKPAPQSRTAGAQSGKARPAAAADAAGGEKAMVGTSPVLDPQAPAVGMPAPSPLPIMPDLSKLPEDPPASLPSTSVEDVFAKRWAVEDVRRWLQYTTDLAGRWLSPVWEASPQEVDTVARPLSTVGPRALEQLLRALNLPERVSEAIFRNPDLIALVMATAGYAAPRVMLLLSTIGKKDGHDERPRDSQPVDRSSEAYLAVDRPGVVFAGSDSGAADAVRGSGGESPGPSAQNGAASSTPPAGVQRTGSGEGEGLPAGTPVPPEVWGAILR